MIAVEQDAFHAFLAKHDEKDWDEVLERLMPAIHAVDQMPTRIWFSFWPLRLARELETSPDVTQTAKRLQLDGRYRLAEQLDSSVEYFMGSRYWSGVKRAILAHAQSMAATSAGLEEQIRRIAGKVAHEKSTEERFVLGITAVGVMSLQQIGIAGFAAAAESSFEIKLHQSAEQLQKLRAGKTSSWLGLLGPKRKHRVTFDESQPHRAFQAMEEQDLSMASGFDSRDFKKQDHRRIAGPIPAECRSGACGYCWIGVLGGQEKLSEVTDFERKRLHYFGYVSRSTDISKHHYIRLSCQAKCHGDVSVVVPPWNGVLDGNKS
jgi:ferredoxin